MFLIMIKTITNTFIVSSTFMDNNTNILTVLFAFILNVLARVWYNAVDLYLVMKRTDIVFASHRLIEKIDTK